ncbi:MAG: TolC family protein [Polyangia bacterium]
MRCRFALGLLLLTLAAHTVAVPAHAGPPPLTLAEALRQAAGAPVVRAREAALRVKRTLDAELGTLVHNPQVSGQLGYRREQGSGGFEGQLAVQQGFSLSGHAAARRRSATREEEVLGAEVEATRLLQQLATAALWAELWAAQQAERQAEEEVALTAQLLERTERLARAGALTQVDVASAQSYLAEVRARRHGIEGEVFDRGLELARALGASEPLRASDGATVVPLPPLADALLEEALRRAPLLPGPAVLQRAVAAERARAAESLAQRGTQVWLGVLGLHEPSTPWAALGTFTLSVPLFERGQRERADQLAAAARLAVEAAGAGVAAQATLRGAFHEVEHYTALARHVVEQLVPAAEREVALRERLLQVGDGTVLEVLVARRALVAARAQAARVQAVRITSEQRLALYLGQLGLLGEEGEKP